MYQHNNILVIPGMKGTDHIDIGSIIRIEATSNYSKIFFSNGKTMVVPKVLKQFEALLFHKGFARTHRSHLVNIACIRRLNTCHMKIILHNQEQVSISRRKRKMIRKQLSVQLAA